MVTQLVKKFPTFYETKSLITVFIWARDGEVLEEHIWGGHL